MNKIIISILIVLTLVGTASASDSIFGTYDNKFFKDTVYTIILNDPVQSEILFDDVYSYFYTTNYFYSTYKNNGTINYKIKIQLSSIRLSDNYIYAVENNKIYQINKINGTIGNVFSKNNEPKIYTEPPEQVFEILINNTNLAPDVPGHPPGTNERIQGVTYWTNTTPIELHVFAHANATSQAVSLNLSINGSVVQQIKLRPLAVAENTYAPLTAIIPKGANYSVSIENYHHYEWREYPVLSGQNGSVSINNYNNYTNITSGIDNASLNLKVNKSGDTMTGDLVIQNITNPDYVHLHGANGLLFTGGDSEFNINSGFDYWYMGLSKWLYSPKVGFISEYMQFNTPIRYTNDSNYYNNNITGVYNLNMTGDLNISGNINMSGNNITNINTISIHNGINMASSSSTNYYRTDSTVSDGIRPYIFSLNVSNVNRTNNATHIFGNGSFTSGFGNIRVKLDNNTDLPYWVEPNLNSINATLWINNTANGTVDIYYGNSTDTSLSNGTHTFNDFSDFETDLNGWSGTRSTVEAYNSTYSFIPVTGSYLRDTPITFPLVYTAYVYFTSVGNIGDNHIQLSIRNSTLVYEVAMGFPTAGQWSYRNGSGGFVTTGISATSGTWHKINVVAYVNATYDYYVDNSLLKSGALALFQVSSPKLNTYRPAASTTYLDNIYIYQYPLLPWAAWDTPQQQQTSPSFVPWCVKVNSNGLLYTTPGGC